MLCHFATTSKALEDTIAAPEDPLIEAASHFWNVQTHRSLETSSSPLEEAFWFSEETFWFAAQLSCKTHIRKYMYYHKECRCALAHTYWDIHMQTIRYYFCFLWFVTWCCCHSQQYISEDLYTTKCHTCNKEQQQQQKPCSAPTPLARILNFTQVVNVLCEFLQIYSVHIYSVPENIFDKQLKNCSSIIILSSWFLQICICLHSPSDWSQPTHVPLLGVWAYV